MKQKIIYVISVITIFSLLNSTSVLSLNKELSETKMIEIFIDNDYPQESTSDITTFANPVISRSGTKNFVIPDPGTIYWSAQLKYNYKEEYYTGGGMAYYKSRSHYVHMSGNGNPLNKLTGHSSNPVHIKSNGTQINSFTWSKGGALIYPANVKLVYWKQNNKTITYSRGSGNKVRFSLSVSGASLPVTVTVTEPINVS